MAGNEGPVGEEKGKTARFQASNGQSKNSDSERSIKGGYRPNPEGGREVRGDGKGHGGEAWKELRQHQCLVPHYGERHKGNQEGRTRQVYLGVLIGFLGAY